ncbi:ThiF family adenylyltransferase [Virgisporangium ochraceum]|uniref:ThiF family adenylyltransferase n=1 Tax=Virgisporangium ochraceum TaxID=65505 RepID=UPI001EF1F329|nr:ThiF family adenylyltransferase [Virgisporangium ochraceum]
MLTSGSAARIAAATATWGEAVIAVDGPNRVFGVVGTSDGDTEMVLDEPGTELHATTLVRSRWPGGWARGGSWVDEALDVTDAQNGRLATRLLRPSLAGLPERLWEAEAWVLVTWSPDAENRAARNWVAWLIVGDQAALLGVEVLRPIEADPIEDLGRHWPFGDLDQRVVVVGLGSIGSAAALALARYGVRDLVLVDPDRLLSHNLVRHQCTRWDVGRYKVDAVRDVILTRWPATRVNALRLHTVYAADVMRPLLRESALVLCAADGVASRRSVNHLARRAECTSVFASVLRDGSVGEVLRVRPWPGTGCLLCVRTLLAEHGTIDPEPQQDADYGTGDPHRPMTAVGSDLELVGGLAAKLAVGTLLEEAGHHHQVFQKDWALIGLQIDRTAPVPFDLYPGQVHWLPAAGEIVSRPECPTCGDEALKPFETKS